MKHGNLKITVLVDNQACGDLSAEHGLSLWIEIGARRILFDTGQGSALADNARKLGIGLGKTDFLVLSHGHYDHTGGVSYVLRRAREVEVYCHPAVVQPRYSVRNGIARPIQMPRDSMAAINRLLEENLHWVSLPVMLGNGIGVAAPIPRETSYEDTGGAFYLDPEGRYPDPIEDDLTLWIQTEEGIVICVGCCHAGLINTLNYVLRISKESSIRAIIGGFHLLNAGDRRLDQTITALRSLKPELVIPCHCTGERAATLLSDALGKRVSRGAAGTIYSF